MWKCLEREALAQKQAALVGFGSPASGDVAEHEDDVRYSGDEQGDRHPGQNTGKEEENEGIGAHREGVSSIDRGQRSAFGSLRRRRSSLRSTIPPMIARSSCTCRRSRSISAFCRLGGLGPREL
jgi:hypothetical protein